MNLLSDAELLAFVRELEEVVRTGLPVLEGLSAMNSPHARKAAREIADGIPFHQALSRRGVFSKEVIALVRAGEASGSLDAVLGRLAAQLEARVALRKKLIRMMIYPAIVGSLALTVLGFFLFVLVPLLATALQEQGNLPPFLGRLLGISSALRGHAMLLVVIGAAAAWAVRLWAPTRRGVLSGLKHRLPILSSVAADAALDRLYTTLGLLLESGVSVLEALDILQGVFEDEPHWAAALGRMRAGALEGKTLAEGMDVLFPREEVRRVALAEKAGTVDRMLLELGRGRRAALADKAGKLMAILQAGMMLAVGLLVAGVVVSFYQAIFSVYDAF